MIWHAGIELRYTEIDMNGWPEVTEKHKYFLILLQNLQSCQHPRNTSRHVFKMLYSRISLTVKIWSNRELQVSNWVHCTGEAPCYWWMKTSNRRSQRRLLMWPQWELCFAITVGQTGWPDIRKRWSKSAISLIKSPVNTDKKQHCFQPEEHTCFGN